MAAAYAAALAAAYAATEALYRRLRHFLDTAAISERYVCETYAWWIMVPAGRSGPPHRVEIPLTGSWGDLQGRVSCIPGNAGSEVSITGSLALQLEFLGCVIVDLEPSQSFY